MTQSFSNDAPSPPNALLAQRIIWAALLLGPILFMLVLVRVILPNRQQPPQPQPVLVWSNIIWFLIIVPITFIFRTVTLRRASVDGRVPAAALATGNIIFWAGCEGSAFFGLIVAMLTGSLSPAIITVAIALSLQALTFPLAGKLR
jgi:hypothetical protein